MMTHPLLEMPRPDPTMPRVPPAPAPGEPAPNEQPPIDPPAEPQ